MIWLAAAVLASCATRVSSVVNNEAAYANKFLPAELPAAVAARFSSQREPPLGFGKMALSVVAADPADQRFDVSQIVMENLGGGLVRTIAEETQSGIPASRYYSLTYRGFLALRWNRVHLYEELDRALIEITEFSRFDPMAGAALPEQLRYDYRQRLLGDISTTSRSMTCKLGLQYPARRVYPTLEGDAVELGCEYPWTHDAGEDKDMWAYLLKYGVGLKTFSQKANRFIGYRVQSLSIEPSAGGAS